MTIFAYCRVSTGKQLNGLSMEIQGDQELLDSIAQKYDTSLGTVYSDKGKSAYKGQHLKNEFGKLLLDIDNNIIKKGDILVVRHLDRMSRAKLTSGLSIYLKIVERGIKIYTTMDNHLYSDEPMDFILATLAFKTANEESVRKSYYTLKNAESRISKFKSGDRENGKVFNIGVGHNPFYITLKDKKIEEHPILFNAMKDVIKKYISGYSLKKCCEYLSDQYDHKMTIPGLNESLNSKALYGTLELSLKNLSNTDNSPFSPNIEHVLVDYYPAICDETTYYKINKIKSSRSTSDSNKKEYSLLSGGRFLYCGCGNYLCSIHARNEKKYYRCSKCCFLIPSYTLDLVVIKACCSAEIFSPDKNENDINKEIQSLENELDMKGGKYKKQTDLVFQNPDLFIDKEYLLNESRTELDEISSKIKKLTELSSNSMELLEVDLAYFSDAIKCYEEDRLSENYSKENYHKQFKIIIDKIVVYDDGLIRVSLKNNRRKFHYLPSDYNKSTGLRFGLELIVVSEEDKKQINENMPELSFKYFTIDEIEDKKYITKTKNIPSTLLRQFSPIKNHSSAFDKFSDRIFGFLAENDFIVWKKNFVIKSLGVSERQWLSYKKETLYKDRYNFLTVEYLTAKNNPCSVNVLYGLSMPREDALLSVLPLNPIKITKMINYFTPNV